MRGFARGADDYVVKPFSYGELLGRVRAVLRRAQGRPQRGHDPRGRAHARPRHPRGAAARASRCTCRRRSSRCCARSRRTRRACSRRRSCCATSGATLSMGQTRTVDAHACRLRKKLRRVGRALGRERARRRLPAHGGGVSGVAGLVARARRSPRLCARACAAGSSWWRAPSTSCAGRPPRSGLAAAALRREPGGLRRALAFESELERLRPRARGPGRGAAGRRARPRRRGAAAGAPRARAQPPAWRARGPPDALSLGRGPRRGARRPRPAGPGVLEPAGQRGGARQRAGRGARQPRRRARAGGGARRGPARAWAGHRRAGRRGGRRACWRSSARRTGRRWRWSCRWRPTDDARASRRRRAVGAAVAGAGLRRAGRLGGLPAGCATWRPGWERRCRCSWPRASSTAGRATRARATSACARCRSASRRPTRWPRPSEARRADARRCRCARGRLPHRRRARRAATPAARRAACDGASARSRWRSRAARRWRTPGRARASTCWSPPSRAGGRSFLALEDVEVLDLSAGAARPSRGGRGRRGRRRRPPRRCGSRCARRSTSPRRRTSRARSACCRPARRPLARGPPAVAAGEL